jgi:uncharacterized membrane protein
MSIDAQDRVGASDTPEVFKDSRTRSLLKGLTWRVVATATTIAIVWAITGDTQVAIQIGAVEVVAKIVVYYLHERAWQLLPHNLKLFGG